jgi:hypothetical protein
MTESKFLLTFTAISNTLSVDSIPEVDTFFIILLSQSSLGMEKPIFFNSGIEEDDSIFLKFQADTFCKFQKKIFSLEIRNYFGNFICAK